MIGAIIGDIAGSTFEAHNVKSKDIPIFAPKSGYTDDSLMTIAIAKALMLGVQHGVLENPVMMQTLFTQAMQYIGRSYPTMRGGYGRSFITWLTTDSPLPYNSYGNGSAMRVSPCAYVGNTLKQVLDLAAWSAEVSHNHPEGIKGAQAIAGATYLARKAASKDGIREFIEDDYYNLDFTLDDIRASYEFDVSCKGSVPQAIVAFLESTDFVDAIKNAISIGGDSDTIAAMTGAIAWPFYSRNLSMTKEMLRLKTEVLSGFLNGNELGEIAYEFCDTYRV